MAAKPGNDWAGHDLADLLGIKPRNMLTQLAEWARLGLLAKTGPGRYALPSPADAPGPLPTSRHDVIDTRRLSLTTRHWSPQAMREQP